MSTIKFNIGDFSRKSDNTKIEELEKYTEMANFCNANNLVIEEKQLEDGSIVYMICEPSPHPEPSREEILQQELAEINHWFDEHRYISEKYATNRVKEEDKPRYEAIIAEMDVKAERINEIRAELASLQKVNEG